MIKDRNLKLKLLRYFLYRFWYPEIEVDILSKQRVSAVRKVMTDVDVLGLYPDVTGDFRLILGDCKTQKSQSPVTRSLWMKGLMEYMKASKGFVILEKSIEKDHQLTSAFLEIQLLSEADFDIYSRHTTNPSVTFNSALADMENWDHLLDIRNRFPRLNTLLSFSKIDFWNEEGSNNKLRHSMLALKLVRDELNPANSLHLALVLNHISLIAIALNDIIIKIFNRYLLPKSKQELDDDLKVIIWGGADNYNYLNDLRRRFGSQLGVESDLALPHWDQFLEFIRTCLENPLAFNFVPLFLKEIAFSFFSEREYDYAKVLSSKNPYIVSYSLKLMEYIVRATEMQKDFIDAYSQRFLQLSPTRI